MQQEPTSVSAVSPTSALQFMRTIGQLKTLKRTGWVNHHVALPESVADHMYRMAMIAMILVDTSLNKDKLVKSKSCHTSTYSPCRAMLSIRYMILTVTMVV